MGYHFPLSADNARRKIREHAFSLWSTSSGERINLRFVSGDKSFEYGFPLACLLRHSYLAVFSLPDELFTKQVTAAALDRALQEFSEVDKQPIEQYQSNQYPVYRAYLGPLGQLAIAKDLIRSGGRAYRSFTSSVKPKQDRNETILRKIQL